MELKFTQRQRQNFSVRQQQSVEILQMGHMELENFMHQAVLENPLLEYDESKEEETAAEDGIVGMEWLEENDRQNYVYYEQDYEGEQGDGISNLGSSPQERLADELLSQFCVMQLDEKKRSILEYLVFSLDQRGYYTEEESSTAKLLQVTEAEISECLTILKSVEPAGIGAKNLQECLLLQLQRKEEDVSIAKLIVKEHLELIEENRLELLARKLKISMEELLENIRLIRQLNPKPANGFFYGETLEYIKPDVTVMKVNDKFEIISNEFWNCFSVNAYYSSLLNTNVDFQTKDYIQEKLVQAKWIIQCIQQRTTTMREVTKAIVTVQTKFFDKGKGNLVPLTMLEIGEMVGLHESTVSRTVKDKYLQCAWGIYPMEYFFAKKIKSSEGTVGTSQDTKEKLKELIEQENKHMPLSDQKLSELLKNYGVHISRRTVAKYREQLGIPDKTKRKNYS